MPRRGCRTPDSETRRASCTPARRRSAPGGMRRAELRPGNRVLQFLRDRSRQASAHQIRLRDVADAALDRNLFAGELDQTRRVDQRGGRIVSQADECATEREAARTGIQEVELDGNLQLR